MTTPQGRNDRVLTDAVASYVERHISADADVWPRVRRHAVVSDITPARRRARWHAPLRLRRAGAVAVIALLIAVGAITVTATVPHLRERLPDFFRTSGSGIASSGDGSEIALKPPPSFRIALPAYLPAGLSQRATTYIPAQQSGALQLPSINGAGGLASSPAVGTGSSVRATAQARDLDAPQWLAAEAMEGGAVRLRYYAPADDRSVEIVQRAARRDEGQPMGKAVPVSVGVAAVQPQGGETVLTLTAYGTYVVIRTNLGEAETVKIAQQLRWQPVSPPTQPAPTVDARGATTTAETIIARLPKADPSKIVATIRPDGTIEIARAAPLCPHRGFRDLDAMQFVWNGTIYILQTDEQGGYGISATAYGVPPPPASATKALVDALFAACRDGV